MEDAVTDYERGVADGREAERRDILALLEKRCGRFLKAEFKSMSEFLMATCVRDIRENGHHREERG